MPPGSLSTFAVMKPGPKTARKAISLYFNTPKPTIRRGIVRSRLNIFSFMVQGMLLRLQSGNVEERLRAKRLLENQQDAQHNHYSRRSPGHPVEEPGVYVLAHEARLVDQDEHEDQNKGKKHAVENLRKYWHFEQRKSRQQDNRRAGAHQHRIEPVKDGS